MHQLCWAHLLRNFQAFVDRDGESQRLGQAILAQADLMFEWWHEVRDGTMSRATFQKMMRAVEHQIGQLLRQGILGPQALYRTFQYGAQGLRATCDHSKTAGTCRDILKREDALWTFVRVEGVEPTNNLAERQVRPGVLWRKNSFGTQSETGNRFVERIMTVVATLKQQQRIVLDYLTEACDTAYWGKRAPSLLPDTAAACG